MTRRQRLLTALDHREPDRVPLGYDANAGIERRLFQHFGVDDQAALFDKMGIDGFTVFTGGYVGPKYIGPPAITLEDGTKTDFFGICAQKHEPMAFVRTLSDLDRYRWPSADWFDYSGIKERCLQAKAQEFLTVGGEGGCGLVHATYLRGFERAMMDLVDEPKLAEAYLERMGNFFVEWNERWLDAGEGHFDVYRCGDDVGNMLNMHCSPEQWRRFYKPQLQRIWATARKRGMKIWFHCCGYCRPILPDLIEMGADMWDPAPPTVRDNDLPALKREFGKDITFVGGVNHPDVLVKGTPADVEREVKLRIDQLAPGGGYILGPAQVMTDDMPVENVVRMYEVALEYGRYC